MDSALTNDVSMSGVLRDLLDCRNWYDAPPSNTLLYSTLLYYLKKNIFFFNIYIVYIIYRYIRRAQRGLKWTSGRQLKGG